METSPLHRDEELTGGVRVDMVGLLVACPYNQGNPGNCPLYYIRQLPMVERLGWLDTLEQEEMDLLYRNHRQCLFSRERSAKLEWQRTKYSGTDV